MKRYGDEDFIFLIQEEELANQEENHNNQIQDGFIILKEESISFQERPVSKYGFFMTLPVMFTPMQKEFVEIKYPNNNRPDYILSNPSTTINLTFAYKTYQMEPEKTEVNRDVIQELVMRGQRGGEVIESNTVTAGDIKISYFDFVTSAIDSDIYNLIFFFSLRGRMMMGAFNCLQPDQSDWKEVAIQMLESVRIL